MTQSSRYRCAGRLGCGHSCCLNKYPGEFTSLPMPKVMPVGTQADKQTWILRLSGATRDLLVARFLDELFESHGLPFAHTG